MLKLYDVRFLVVNATFERQRGIGVHCNMIFGSRKLWACFGNRLQRALAGVSPYPGSLIYLKVNFYMGLEL